MLIPKLKQALLDAGYEVVEIENGIQVNHPKHFRLKVTTDSSTDENEPDYFEHIEYYWDTSDDADVEESGAFKSKESFDEVNVKFLIQQLEYWA